MKQDDRINRLVSAMGARGVEAHDFDDVERAIGALGISVDTSGSVGDRIARAEETLERLGVDLTHFDAPAERARRLARVEADRAAADRARVAAEADAARGAAERQAATDAAVAAAAAALERAFAERQAADLEAEAARLSEAADVMAARASAARAELEAS